MSPGFLDKPESSHNHDHDHDHHHHEHEGDAADCAKCAEEGHAHDHGMTCLGV